MRRKTYCSARLCRVTLPDVLSVTGSIAIADTSGLLTTLASSGSRLSSTDPLTTMMCALALGTAALRPVLLDRLWFAVKQFGKKSVDRRE